MIDVLQLIPLRPEVQSELERRYRVHGKDKLDQVAQNVRAIVTNSHSGPDAALIDRLPNLEIIASASVGYDGIAVSHAQSKGIPVTNTPDVLNNDVADLAVALMIVTARKLVPADRYVREGRWPMEGEYPLAHRASSKRVGILGLGRIGREIAKRVEAMHCSVAYHSRNPVADVPYRYYPDLTEMARESDFLMVMVPLNAQTRGIVDHRVMEALGPKGILINIARGGVVDEPAMIALLQEGKLGGAGLDVFAKEPGTPPELAGMDNVVMAPHIGSATYETRRKMGQLVLDNMDAFFAGRPLLTEIPSIKNRPVTSA